MTSKEAWQKLMQKLGRYVVYDWQLVEFKDPNVTLANLDKETEEAFINYVKAKVEEEQNAQHTSQQN